MNPLDSFTVERLEELINDRRICVDDWVRDLAKIALAAKQAEPVNYPEIPEGWVLVPKELNVSMNNAMTDGILDDMHNADIWRLMLSAGPKPE